MDFRINFFKKQHHEAVNYQLIFNYLAEMTGSNYHESETEAVFTIIDPVFASQYSFHFTRQSKVRNIYNLDPSYLNLKIYIDFPLISSEMILRNVLKTIDQFCRTFNVEIYHDSMADIAPFDFVTMIHYLVRLRDQYLEMNPDYDFLYLNHYPLNQVFNYLQVKSLIKEDNELYKYLKEYQVYEDLRINQPVFAINYQLGQPLVVGPQLNYLIIYQENELLGFISYADFEKLTNKKPEKIVEYSPDFILTYYNQRLVKKIKRNLKKLTKNLISPENYRLIKINQLIEI